MLNEDQKKSIRLIIEAGASPNYTAIAESLGVTPKTLYNWRQDAEFQAELSKDGAELLIGRLFELGLQGDIGAGKLYMQHKGLLVEGNKTDPVAQLMNISPDEREQFKWDIYDEMKAKANKRGGKKATAGIDSPIE